ncbi:unnamed protein product [[Candida] boidinii]|nr:unnamed protein product [[Candida] boidinii]
MSGIGESIDSTARMASSSSTFNTNSNTRPASSQPPAKRKRLKPSFSCLPCRTKKTKCDRKKPVCGKCAKSGFDESLCLYQSGNSWTNITVVESDNINNKNNNNINNNSNKDTKLNISIQDSPSEVMHTHSPFPSLSISSSPAPILSDIRSTTPNINDVGRQQQHQQQQIQGIRLAVPDATNSDISTTTTDRTTGATTKSVNINNGGVPLPKPMSFGNNSPTTKMQFQSNNRINADTSNNVTPVNDISNSSSNSNSNSNFNTSGNTNNTPNNNSYRDAFHFLNSELIELKSVVESLDNVLKSKISSGANSMNQEIQFNSSQINNGQLPNQKTQQITENTPERNGEPNLYVLSKDTSNLTTEETPLNINSGTNSKNSNGNGSRSGSQNFQTPTQVFQN